jgi:hypothetical protein
MAGLSQKEYNNQVDEALIMFGGGAPCCNIDPRLWGDFKELYKEFNDAVPKTINWSHEQVCEWMEGYEKAKIEQTKNR